VSHPGQPWLTPAANRFLEGWLEDSFRGLEWGAGRSTLWFAERVAELLSVEHAADWYAQVQSNLDGLGCTNVTLAHASEADYVEMASELDDASLDFALVDGLSDLRDCCAAVAIPKIRPGGVLIVDDVHRYLPSFSRAPLALAAEAQPLTSTWVEIRDALADWELDWTSDGVKDTAIWVRP
jgi:hypothetical protein